MDFINGYIRNLRRRPITDYPATQVVEVRCEEYVLHKPYCRDDSLMVYGLPDTEIYEVVFQKDTPAKGTQTAYRYDG